MSKNQKTGTGICLDAALLAAQMRGLAHGETRKRDLLAHVLDPRGYERPRVFIEEPTDIMVPRDVVGNLRLLTSIGASAVAYVVTSQTTKRGHMETAFVHGANGKYLVSPKPLWRVNSIEDIHGKPFISGYTLGDNKYDPRIEDNACEQIGHYFWNGKWYCSEQEQGQRRYCHFSIAEGSPLYFLPRMPRGRIVWVGRMARDLNEEETIRFLSASGGNLRWVVEQPGIHSDLPHVEIWLDNGQCVLKNIQNQNVDQVEVPPNQAHTGGVVFVCGAYYRYTNTDPDRRVWWDGGYGRSFYTIRNLTVADGKPLYLGKNPDRTGWAPKYRAPAEYVIVWGQQEFLLECAGVVHGPELVLGKPYAILKLGNGEFAEWWDGKTHTFHAHDPQHFLRGANNRMYVDKTPEGMQVFVGRHQQSRRYRAVSRLFFRDGKLAFLGVRGHRVYRVTYPLS